MRRGFKVLLAFTLLLTGTRLSAADISTNATRDAARLVVCMKAFDAACVNSLTNTKVFEDHGISRDQLDQQVGAMYQQMKGAGARYSRFELGAPRPPFVSRDVTYLFIPYDMVLKGGGRYVTAKSFFIGVSGDSGISWKFVDGQKVTQENVAMIIPGYSGGALPPTSLNQTAGD
jgi:hypothetical protein